MLNFLLEGRGGGWIYMPPSYKIGLIEEPLESHKYSEHRKSQAPF